MPRIAKAALCGLAFAVIILVTFSVPQTLKLWLKQATQTADGAPAPVSIGSILGWASIPALVAGTVMFGVAWYFLARMDRDASSRTDAP